VTSRDELDQRIFSAIQELIGTEGVVVDYETRLIGDQSALDSMKLVEVCLCLEDLSVQMGFDFDWTSEAAMSRSRSMFRTAGSLAEEFRSQMAREK
jgi:hypothetical protein